MFKKLLLLICYIALCQLTIVNCYAESVYDPTRPLFLKAKPKKIKKSIRKILDISNWKLSSVLISDKRRVAIINDVIVSVGRKIKGAKVIAISKSRVKLKKGSKVFEIYLSPKAKQQSGSDRKVLIMKGSKP